MEILSRAESDIGKARVIVAGYMAREKMAMEQANDYGIVKGERKWKAKMGNITIM